MPCRFALSSLALVATLGLAGCNASQQPVASASQQASAPASATPPDFNLPPGAACTGDINRYATLIYGDNSTGMVDSSVFEQIRIEIAQAADVCRAGHDVEARTLLAASKHKHGYPT